MSKEVKNAPVKDGAFESIETLIVLDFGGETGQAITRKIRELGVYSEILAYDTPAEKIKKMNVKGIIFSGSPKHAYEETAYKVDPEIYNLDIPILGICYGLQLIAIDFGGKVFPSKTTNYGKEEIDRKSTRLNSSHVSNSYA